MFQEGGCSDRVALLQAVCSIWKLCAMIKIFDFVKQNNEANSVEREMENQRFCPILIVDMLR